MLGTVSVKGITELQSLSRPLNILDRISRMIDYGYHYGKPVR